MIWWSGRPGLPVVPCPNICRARSRRTVPRRAAAGCGGTLRELNEDVSEVLEYVPESFKVVRHVRPKFSCGRCETVVEQVRGSPPEIRHAARQTRAGPVIENLRRWLERTLQNLSAKSDMTGAIRYALTRWTALICGPGA